jgi:hypothetical protein
MLDDQCWVRIAQKGLSEREENKEVPQHDDHPAKGLARKKGVSTKGTKDKVQARCKNKDMPIEEEIKETEKGWEGKPKGMLQVLWERGFIDPAKKKEGDCAIDGKKDAFGNVIRKTSLKHLMSLLVDFIQEETLLQCHGSCLGWRWNGLRSAPIPLRVLVRALSMIGVVQKVSVAVHQFLKREQKASSVSQQRRWWIRMRCSQLRAVAFLANNKQGKNACWPATFWSDNSEEMDTSKAEAVVDEKKPHMTAHLIEKILKQCKSHRSAKDFDAGFLNRIVDKMWEQQHGNNKQFSWPCQQNSWRNARAAVQQQQMLLMADNEISGCGWWWSALESTFTIWRSPWSYGLFTFLRKNPCRYDMS